jgi:hypothetical protein
METLIFENTCASVYYIPELQLGKIVWNGNPAGDLYKDPFRKLIAHAVHHPTPNFLSDTTNQGIVNPENRKWFETHAIPDAINAGLKRAGIITSANVFKRYYLNMILSATNKFGLPVKMFESEEEAHKWFESFTKK